MKAIGMKASRKRVICVLDFITSGQASYVKNFIVVLCQFQTLEQGLNVSGLIDLNSFFRRRRARSKPYRKIRSIPRRV